MTANNPQWGFFKFSSWIFSSMYEYFFRSSLLLSKSLRFKRYIILKTVFLLLAGFLLGSSYFLFSLFFFLCCLFIPSFLLLSWKKSPVKEWMCNCIYCITMQYISIFLDDWRRLSLNIRIFILVYTIFWKSWRNSQISKYFLYSPPRPPSFFLPRLEVEVTEIIFMKVYKTFVSWIVTNLDPSQILDFPVP